MRLVTRQIGRFSHFADHSFAIGDVKPPRKIVFTFPHLPDEVAVCTRMINNGVVPEVKVSDDQFQPGQRFGCAYLLPETDQEAAIGFIKDRFSGEKLRLMNFDASNAQPIP